MVIHMSKLHLWNTYDSGLWDRIAQKLLVPTRLTLNFALSSIIQNLNQVSKELSRASNRKATLGFNRKHVNLVTLSNSLLTVFIGICSSFT